MTWFDRIKALITGKSPEIITNVSIKADSSSVAALHVGSVDMTGPSWRELAETPPPWETPVAYVDYIESVTLTGDRHGKVLKVDGETIYDTLACSAYMHPHKGHCRCIKLCVRCNHPEKEH